MFGKVHIIDINDDTNDKNMKKRCMKMSDSLQPIVHWNMIANRMRAWKARNIELRFDFFVQFIANLAAGTTVSENDTFV